MARASEPLYFLKAVIYIVSGAITLNPFTLARKFSSFLENVSDVGSALKFVLLTYMK